jgi:membrane peptidoglycan carboxypeptidase
LKKWVRRACLAIIVAPVAIVILAAIFLLIVWFPNIRHVYSYDLQSLRSGGGHAVSAGAGTESDDLPLVMIPARFQEVFLAAEEPDFYARPAFNPVVNLIGMIAGGRRPITGSTLAHQLTKWVLFDPQVRHGGWLIESILMDYRIEYELTKAEIFTAYLNGIVLAPGTRGVAGAARFYFDKPLSDLDLAEMVYIAARARGGICARQAWAEERSRFILDRLVALGRIDAAQSTAAAEEIATLRPALPSCAGRRS